MLPFDKKWNSLDLDNWIYFKLNLDADAIHKLMGWKRLVLGDAYTATSDNVGAEVHCRWIGKDGLDGLVRDMLD